MRRVVLVLAGAGRRAGANLPRMPALKDIGAARATASELLPGRGRLGEAYCVCAVSGAGRELAVTEQMRKFLNNSTNILQPLCHRKLTIHFVTPRHRWETHHRTRSTFNTRRDNRASGSRGLYGSWEDFGLLRFILFWAARSVVLIS